MSEISVDHTRGYETEKYALSGKIMLSAIVILFTVVILIICLHIYARWFLARSHRRQQILRNRRRSNRAHIIFTTTNITTSSTTISHGLDSSLLKSLPTFIFTSKSNTQKEEEIIECAVCLSEFEENEMGRLLPKCNHSFHIGCIDMWFHSHSTCPLCRSPVEPINDSNNKIEIITDSAANSSQQHQQSNLETSSGVLCSSCEMGSTSSSSSRSSSNSNDNTTVGSRRKVGVSIEVPRRNDQNLKSSGEEIQESPRGQAFKSPGGRISSFRRMLSRERRPSTPSTPIPCSFPDLERGEIEEQQIVHQSSNHHIINKTKEPAEQSL